MSWLPLGFGFPAILFGLLALPVIWWLLRLTPPRPETEVFPPLKILARVLKKEETPHKSPWWLTLLRLLMAALIVLALAEPVYNPRERIPANGSALAMVIDNGWASSSDWEKRVAAAERLIKDAERNSIPIVLAFTAEPVNTEIGPFRADEARNRLNAVRPRPVPADRGAVYGRVAGVLKALPGASVALLTDGLASPADRQAFAALLAEQPADLIWAAPDKLDLAGITTADNEVDRFVITAIRPPAGAAPAHLTAGAFDIKGRRIGDAAITFKPGETQATGEIVVPFELRNDFSSIALDGVENAGAVRVLDDTDKRRRVGLLSQTPIDQAHLLLSPLYYIRRALDPFADVVEPASPDLAEAIPQLLDQKPAVIVMGDVGTIPDSVRAPLVKWMEEGGTLVRFASSRLLSAGNDQELLPVTLRLGERVLGGTLSWSEPQPVGDFPPNGPFSDLPPPSEVSVTRQILAEPSPELVDHTWATLADGTPLVTADRRKKGIVVFFHVAPQATWSNLPISGTFVEMLRRIVQLSRNQGIAAEQGAAATATLPPYRMIGADGTLQPPGPDARPLETGKEQGRVTLENPPGLYGTEDGVVAHNLLASDAVLTPIARPATTIPISTERYALDESRDLRGPLLAAALALLFIDGIVMLWLTGLFSRRWIPSRRATASLALALGASLLLRPADLRADDFKPGDPVAVDAISQTHIAYVITGDPAIDSISRAGLTGLTRFLAEKTALEPGEPAGVDLEQDQLAFYPIIYWPIDQNARVPSESALSRIDEYMKEGGTVLFDTRDQFSSGLDAAASPATMRLREIVGHLNVPPLEPVPPDHVLTKSFYILSEFPGRYSGSPLWVEASLDATNEENRPVRTGDGVSPILITANDLAGAWAEDEDGEPLLPTVPSDPMQRLYAFRAGVNIMMYMLTGNYKSDQVHVPALLERLGQ